MNNLQLKEILEKLKCIHLQLPEKTKEQNRIKCNLYCCIVYLEDELQPKEPS